MKNSEESENWKIVSDYETEDIEELKENKQGEE